MARSSPKVKSTELRPHASVLVADDVLYSLVGKAFLQGVYMSDIAIPAEQVVAGQLVFMFLVEASTDVQFRSFTLEVTMPGSETVKAEVPLPPMQNIPAGRRFVSYRLPLVLRNPVLRPGRIETKITYDGGELEANAIWITTAQTVLDEAKKIN